MCTNLFKTIQITCGHKRIKLKRYKNPEYRNRY